ncbi:MAG: hypothetical protein K1X88_11500 [Nannocystaceae bacterium]|nr:hypothetical protein [Nannocystaceae bacterium]
MEPFMTQLQHSLTAAWADWGRTARETLERVESLAAGAQQVQHAQLERVVASVDESARWARSSFAAGEELAQAYGRAMMTAWRRALAWEPESTPPAA